MRKVGKVLFGLVLVIILCTILVYYFTKSEESAGFTPVNNKTENLQNEFANHPLSIEYQRKKDYPGSQIVIEEDLGIGSNYHQYITSYKSEGLKIYALLAIPTTPKPEGGYPAIIFNHGYIPPEEYRTNERYVAYFAGFANNGYIVFKPDYRGHGLSEGEPTGAYFSPAYLTDVLNALSSIRQHKDVNPEKIGMWGHSLGGFLTLRSMVVSKDIRAGVIWGGVVGSYKDMQDEWWSKRNRTPWSPSGREQSANRPSRQKFIDQYGEPTDESPFWSAISAASYLKDVSGPIQLHHGTGDETVPFQLSKILYNRMLNEGKEVEYFEYPGSDHNITQGFNLAMQRSVEFFDRYLK